MPLVKQKPLRITLHTFITRLGHCDLVSIKIFLGRVINLLLTSLAQDRTWGILAISLFCTDQAALGPYCQDLRPILCQYCPRIWLIRCMYFIPCLLYILWYKFFFGLNFFKGAWYLFSCFSDCEFETVKNKNQTEPKIN